MTNEECDLLIKINEKPRCVLMCKDMTDRELEVAHHLCVTTNFLVAFVGDWIALTDAGKDAALLHCAQNF